jgi:hypothetical protein
VKLIDIHSGRKRKLTGSLSGGANSLSFSQCGCYIACSGLTSREILLFDVQTSATSGDNALCVIAVVDVPAALYVKSNDDQTVDILCIFENTFNTKASQSRS